jgi:uncharacterized coiled-coil protein SlyX
LRDRIQAECSQEVRNALQGNIEGLKANIAEYEKAVSSLVSKTNKQMDYVNEQMKSHLREFESSKKQFFMFDGIKNFFFWASQAVSFGTLALIVYFLFFRG